MSFWRSFFGTCRGPYIFHDLCKKHSWGRVIWHLFVLCLLCSICIGIGNYLMVKFRWRAAYHKFNEVFGASVELSESGIIPRNAPDENRRQELPYNTLLIYTPEGPDAEYADETLEKRNLIIVWNQAGLFVFTRHDGDLWSWVRYLPDGSLENSADLIGYPAMKDKMIEFAGMKLGDSRWAFPESMDGEMDSYRLFRLIRFGFAVGKAALFFVSSLMLILFTSLIFSVIYWLLSMKKQLFSFTTLWKTAVYAAFPVILVVNAFPALQLPGTNYYSYLFLIGWTGYLFYVLRYMALNPSADEEDEKKQGEANGSN